MIGFFIYLFKAFFSKKEANNHPKTVKEQLEEKRLKKIEKWKEYAEKLVIESGIDLENVLVHNLGRWGLAGSRAYSINNFCVMYSSREHGELKFPLPSPDKPFIIVPEIVDSWTFRAWVHEIGHYVNGHYDEVKKKRFIQEYEAEKFCFDKCSESGVVDSYDLIDIKYSAIAYLDSHIDKAIELKDIRYIEDIPQEVLDFLYMADCMKEEIEKKNLPSSEQLSREIASW
jgi:hypothetical protein